MIYSNSTSRRLLLTLFLFSLSTAYGFNPGLASSEYTLQEETLNILQAQPFYPFDSYSQKVEPIYLHPLGSRPQDPEPPYPYQEEEVLFKNENAGVQLAGTLTYPFEGGPFPCVVLITGSGPQDRDETIMDHRPFLVLSDYLTRLGIAVLRYDERGVGESSGDYNTATSADFAEDARAAIDFLQTQPTIDSRRIGLIGHSEGGLIAPMIASQTTNVAFIVMMAGPGLPGDTILLLQHDLLSRAAGVPESYITQTRIIKENVIEIVKQQPDNDAALSEIRHMIYDAYPTVSHAQLEYLVAEYAEFTSPWMRFFLTYDPRPALEQTQCPVLALNGEKDLQVPPKENLSAIETALQAGGNNQYTIVELPDLNHLFQTAETGAVEEYELIDETIAPAALELMGNWIVEITNELPVQSWTLY